SLAEESRVALLLFQKTQRDRGGLVVRPRLRCRRVPGSKVDTTEYLVSGPVAREIICRSNVLPLVWCRSLEWGLLAQALSWSSDPGSK
ncbi:hypothetical protein AVEN_11972-1, partial [Araneus ventricosus]